MISLSVPRFPRRRILLLLTAIAVAAGVAIGLAVWPSGTVGTAGGTIPGGARVVTVTPVFGLDPNTRRHHLDHPFTITNPAEVARIAAIINGLAPFPVGELSCAEDNGAAMRLTFRTTPGRPGGSPGAPNMPFLEDYTSSGQQVQQLVLAIAGVRWPYTPDVLPPFHH